MNSIGEDAFEVLLRGHDLMGLHRHAGAVYGLWPDLTLAWFNDAWFRFAEDNGGEGIRDTWGHGRPVLDAVPEIIRPWFETAYGRCFETNQPAEHVYECSNADVFRRFHQIIYPLPEQAGLLVVNSLVVEHDHDMPGVEVKPASPTEHKDEHGLIHMCCHCRRVRNTTEEERWDWVPEWVVQQPEPVSHGLCPSCFGHWYPERATVV